MDIFRAILDFLKSCLQWWFIVEPWEQAVRVRFGKGIKLFSGGTHFRIPFFDSVYTQNVRRRLISIGSQTLTTRDRKLVTVHSTLGFTITDVLQLQQSLHDAEGTILQHVTALLSNDIAAHDLIDCAPADIIERAKKKLDMEKYGLGNMELALTSYIADIRTLRVINDTAAPYIYSSSLVTTADGSFNNNSPPRSGR